MGEVTKKVELNSEQRTAVDHRSGPMLVVAGAGTGKTRVIVERAAALAAEGVPPKRILALTFTEKAAAEMLDRINDATGTYQLDMPIMTFNAYGESLLRRYGSDIGVGSTFTLMGESAQIVFLQERIEKLELDYYFPLGSRTGAILDDITKVFSSAKQNVITPEEYLSFTEKLPAKDDAERMEKKKHHELARAYKTYISLCREANVIDYDDQIYLLIELLKRRPNILKRVQDSYDYIMVDEFQDTNIMQSELVDMIVGANQNLFVVGDDDQSIYGFRGATLHNILDFKKRYPKTNEVALVNNYRSSQEILDCAYTLIQNNNPHRLEHQLGIDKRLVSDKSGSRPKIRQFESLAEELTWIAKDIQQRIKNGTPPGDIAVLLRRNKTLPFVSEALDNIQHVVVGQRHKLYREPVVRMVIEAIKATVDEADNLSLFHTLTGPLFSLPAAEISKLASEARRRHSSLADIAANSDNEEIKSALASLEQWRTASAASTVRQLTINILDSSGYKDVLVKTAGSEPAAATAVISLNELLRTMRQFEQIAAQPSSLQYLEALPALEAAGDTVEDGTLDLSGEAVNILTIHKSKGLEWPVVYIPDCTEGSFPLQNNNKRLQLPDGLSPNSDSEADEKIAEERRLMYVAMTRARDELVLTHSELHRLGGRKRRPSRFLTEACAPEDREVHEASGKNTLTLNDASPAAKAAVVIPSSILDGEHVTLSASQADKYNYCPYDFYYKYVLSMPEEQSAAMAYGTLMHSMVETINRCLMEGETIKLPELQVKLQADWPLYGFETKEQRLRELKRAESVLEAVYSRMMDEKRVPSDVEKPFRATIKEHNVTLKGRFDVVFSDATGTEIRDYKTSAGVDTEEKAKKRATASEQLALYSLAWQIMNNEVPLVTLDFVDTGVRGSVRKTARGLTGVAGRLVLAADGIRAYKFPPKGDHHFCSHPEI